MMKAIIGYTDGRPVECKLVPKPIVLPGTVIVKVIAAFISHRDLMICTGLYPFPKGVKEICCGLSCTGKVVEVGEGVSNDLIGKKVFLHSFRNEDPEKVYGCYCQFARYPAQSLMILDETVKYEEACGDAISSLLVVEKAVEMNAKSFVLFGAVSETGRMILAESMKRGFEVIAIVRKTWQEDLLKAKGAKHIINSTDPKFISLLNAKCTVLNCKLAFDAVGGGDNLEKLIQGMLPGSHIWIYGFLGDGKIKNLSPVTIAMKNATLHIFNSDIEYFKKDAQTLKKFRDYIAEDLRTTKCLKLDVTAMFTLDKVTEALSTSEKIEGRGKVIFIPNFSLD